MKTIWLRLSNIGITSQMAIDTSRKIILTNQLSYISFSIVLLMNLSFVFVKAIEFNPISFLSAFIILINPLLNRQGHYMISAISFSTLMPVSILFFSSISKTQIPPPIPLLVYIFPKLLLLSFLVLPLILIDSRRKIISIIAITINLACIFLVEYVNEWFGVGIDFSQVSFENYERINFFIIFPITVLLVGFISLNRINHKYEMTIIKQNLKLEKANEQINEINNNLTDSIHYAECIQRAILPESKLLYDYFNDHFIFYKAKSIVSGDFYFIKELRINDNKCLVLSAADCTGHGVPGGFMSVLGMSLLNEIVKEGNVKDAADILNQLRERIKLALNQTGKSSEQKDGIEMALIMYYPDLDKIDFAGSKCPLYLISENQEITIYKGDRMPIGVHYAESAFTNISIDLQGGEMAYMFTDGIVDQMNMHGKKLLAKNLRTILSEINIQTCAQQEALFTGKMASWMKISNHEMTEQIDDMLMIGVRLNEKSATD